MTDTADNNPLYQSLLSCDLSDPAGQLSFEARLASQNGWTLGHATRVCLEYRRFLYLTQSAGQPMCPSPDVDQAWHLHLTQTRAYQTMCDQILGRFLHHDPSREGAQELRRHQAMYEATLHAYATAFGEPPPAAIWPALEQRFRPRAPAPPEASWRFPVLLHGTALSWLGLVAMAAAGGWLLAWTVAGPVWRDVGGAAFVVAYLIALASIGGALLAHRRFQQAFGAAPPALDPYEVAWLAGGRERVVGTALASLVDRGALVMTVQKTAGKITGGTCRRTAHAQDTRDLHAVERALLADLPEGPVDRQQLRQVASDRFQPLVRVLERAGLLHRAGHLPRVRAVAGGLLAVLLVIGFSRLWHALSHGQAVVILLILLMLTASVSAHMFAVTGGPTGLGVRALAQSSLQARQTQHAALAGHPGGSARPVSGPLLTLAFALLGTQAVMAMDHYAGINYLFGSGSGNVTGDSRSVAGCAGGCGGGCGGCGGCG